MIMVRNASWINTLCVMFNFIRTDIKSFLRFLFMLSFRHTKETDIWPLGCLLHEMLTLRKTFNVKVSIDISVYTFFSFLPCRPI